MPLPSATTLRLRLILLVVLGALLFSGVTVFRAVMDRNHKVQELQNETARMAKGSAENVSHVLESAQRLLLSLASNESVSKMDGPAASALFAAKLKESNAYMNLGMVQPDGLILASALPKEGSVYIADRTYTSRLQKKRDFSVSEYLTEEITGKPTLKLGYPLPGQPNLIPPGVVYASLDLSVLHDAIATAKLPANALVLVTDRQGIYVARHPDVDQWVGTKSRSWELMEARGEERTGFIESTGADLIPRTYYYTPVPGSDGSLFVAVGVSNAGILAECKTALLQKLYGIGFITALALVAAWYLGKFYAVILKRMRQEKEPTRKMPKESGNAVVEPYPIAQELPPQSEPAPQKIEEVAELQAEELPAEPLPLGAAPGVVPTIVEEVPSVPKGVEELPQPPAPVQQIAQSSAPAELPAAPLEIPHISEPTRRVSPADLIPAETTIPNGAQQLHKAPSIPADNLIPAPVATILSQPIPSINLNASPNMNSSPHNEHDGAPELQHLAQSFESMSTVLREHNERLERAVREQTAAVTAVDQAWEQEVTRHRQAELALKARRIEQEQVIRQLQEALDQVKSITGLLPHSGESRKIHDEKGRWNQQTENHFSAPNGAQHSNGFPAEPTRRPAPDLKIDRPPLPAKLNGFDAGPLYFADLKIEVPPTPNKPL